MWTVCLFTFSKLRKSGFHNREGLRPQTQRTLLALGSTCAVLLVSYYYHCYYYYYYNITHNSVQFSHFNSEFLVSWIITLFLLVFFTPLCSVCGLWAGRFGVRFPVGQDTFSSPERPDPASFSMGTLRFFPSIQCQGTNERSYTLAASICLNGVRSALPFTFVLCNICNIKSVIGHTTDASGPPTSYSMALELLFRG